MHKINETFQKKPTGLSSALPSHALSSSGSDCSSTRVNVGTPCEQRLQDLTKSDCTLRETSDVSSRGSQDLLKLFPMSEKSSTMNIAPLLNSLTDVSAKKDVTSQGSNDLLRLFPMSEKSSTMNIVPLLDSLSDVRAKSDVTSSGSQNLLRIFPASETSSVMNISPLLNSMSDVKQVKDEKSAESLGLTGLFKTPTNNESSATSQSSSLGINRLFKKSSKEGVNSASDATSFGSFDLIKTFPEYKSSKEKIVAKALGDAIHIGDSTSCCAMSPDSKKSFKTEKVVPPVCCEEKVAKLMKCPVPAINKKAITTAGIDFRRVPTKVASCPVVRVSEPVTVVRRVKSADCIPTNTAPIVAISRAPVSKAINSHVKPTKTKSCPDLRHVEPTILPRKSKSEGAVPENTAPLTKLNAKISPLRRVSFGGVRNVGYPTVAPNFAAVYGKALAKAGVAVPIVDSLTLARCPALPIATEVDEKSDDVTQHDGDKISPAANVIATKSPSIADLQSRVAALEEKLESLREVSISQLNVMNATLSAIEKMNISKRSQ